MCGILGYVSLSSKSVEREEFQKALNTLSHRGPDQNNIEQYGGVTFGHARLSIIDLEGGRQPLEHASGHLHLVANGEVYNYVEIAKAYPKLSAQSLTQSDSEAIFQVYQSAGVEGFKQLNGMFAFALYDGEKDKIILCRDRLGIKPLYFATSPEAIIFASEIKALLPLLNRSPEINPEALGQFLQSQFSTGRHTIFKGISRVLPGEYIEIEKGELSYHRYWSPENIGTRNINVNQAMEEFEPLFDKVIREHMRADVPFGLFLSGGIDSSVLLAKLSKLHGNKLNTYSIGFENVAMDDELDAATSLAAHFGTQHVPIKVSRDELFNRIVHSIWAADDLMRDYASLPTLTLSDRASDDLKIVFSGEGGDEAFAGYRRYRPGLARWFNHTVLRRGLRNQDWHEGARMKVLTEQLQSVDPKTPFWQLWDKTPRGWSVMQKRQYVDLFAALSDNLFVKADRMMMAFGLEGRVPFADHRMVEFGLSLPDSVKYHNGRGKWLIRQWAKKYLPEDHLSKPKRGFHVPVKEWLSEGFLDSLTQKLVLNRAVNEWFNIEGVNYILAAQKRGENYSREIWGLMQFAIWHRLFVENPGVVPNKYENPLDWL